MGGHDNPECPTCGARLCGIAAYIVEAYRRQLPKPGAIQIDKGGLLRIYQLFNTAKAAKRAAKETTKPLLHMPDETVARALDIAQASI